MDIKAKKALLTWISSYPILKNLTKEMHKIKQDRKCNQSFQPAEQQRTATDWEEGISFAKLVY